MADQQTWKIVATPKDRWALTILMMHKDLKFKGKRRTLLYRFRQALGLMNSTEAFLSERKGRIPLALDNRTRHVFTVTAENADFLNEVLNELELHASQLAGLERVANQLEEKKASCSLDLLPEFTQEVGDAESWQHTTAPILDDPDTYVQINAALLARAQGDFKTYTELYIKEAAPAESEESPRAVAA